MIPTICLITLIVYANIIKSSSKAVLRWVSGVVTISEEAGKEEEEEEEEEKKDTEDLTNGENTLQNRMVV